MRVEGWESQLNAYLEAPAAFAWGQTDCALWCADWVKLATGDDFAADWRGEYATEAELAALLADRGFTSPADLPTSVGLAEIAVGFAQRGDIVLWSGCLGICNGVDSYFLTDRGVTRVRTRMARQAWRVG